MFLWMFSVIPLIVTLHTGNYKERNEAHNKLLISETPSQFLLDVYKSTKDIDVVEARIHLKEILKERWRIEKTEKYALYSCSDSYDMVPVSEAMWDDYNKIIEGEVDVWD